MYQAAPQVRRCVLRLSLAFLSFRRKQLIHVVVVGMDGNQGVSSWNRKNMRRHTAEWIKTKPSDCDVADLNHVDQNQVLSDRPKFTRVCSSRSQSACLKPNQDSRLNFYSSRSCCIGCKISVLTNPSDHPISLWSYYQDWNAWINSRSRILQDLHAGSHSKCGHAVVFGCPLNLILIL